MLARIKNSGQTIILKAEKEYKDHDWRQGRTAARLLQYDQIAPATRDKIYEMRRRMANINRWINQFDVGICDLDVNPANLRWDPTDRRLYRVFTHGRVEFDHHGRLYGGFWIAMPKEERWRIGIDGHPLVQLDFNAMFVRLLYAIAQKPLPSGDPYEWPEGRTAGLS